jgi:hypothetical protein
MNIICAFCLRTVGEDPYDDSPNWYTFGCEMCYDANITTLGNLA